MLNAINSATQCKYHPKIYAQAGMNNLAIEYLRKAILEGFHDKVGLQQDQEFAGLRGMPEFQQLISSARR